MYTLKTLCLSVILVAVFALIPEAVGTPNYHHLGCFKDKHQRALPLLLGTFHNPKTAVQQCAAVTMQKGYVTFGVQYGGQCWSGSFGDLTYDKYGRSKKCKGGIGSAWANDVYQFPMNILLERLRNKYNSLKATVNRQQGQLAVIRGQIMALQSKDRALDGRINAVNGRLGRAHVSCHTRHTGWNQRDSKPIVYLDRHNVNCPTNYYLAQFHLNRSGHLIRYTFKCCRFVL